MTRAFLADDRSAWSSLHPVDGSRPLVATGRPRILVVRSPESARPLAREVQWLMPHAVVTEISAALTVPAAFREPGAIDLAILGACATGMPDPGDWLTDAGVGAPCARVVVCYSECTRLCAQGLMRSGIAALVPDGIDGSVLVQIIQLVLAGLRYAPPDLILDCTGSECCVPPAPRTDLSPRERQVAGFLARGQSNKEIARRLGVSEITIKVHVSNLLRKLQARNRTEAATHLLASGLVPPAEPLPVG